MRKGRLLVILGLLIVISLIAACVAPTTPGAPTSTEPKASAPAAKVYIMKFNDNYPSGDYRSIHPKEWAKYVQDHSNGRIQVQYYEGSSLYKALDTPEALSIGAIQAMYMPSNTILALIPVWNVTWVPGLIDSWEIVYKIWDGEVGKRLLQSMESKGMKGIAALTYHTSEADGLGTKDAPIKVPGDLSGRRVRVSSDLNGQMMAKFGATPVTMAGGELFMAIQRGTIDAAQIGFAHFSQRKLHEAGIKYLTLCPVGQGSPEVVAVNKKFFDELPSDLQTMMLEAGKRIIDVGSRELMQKMQNEDIKYATDNGVITYRYTPQENALWDTAVNEATAAMVQDAGPSAKELLNMVRQLKK